MIQYKTRREAETAMLKSNQFTERSLQLTWHTISLGDSTGNLNYYRIEMILVLQVDKYQKDWSSKTVKI